MSSSPAVVGLSNLRQRRLWTHRSLSANIERVSFHLQLASRARQARRRLSWKQEKASQMAEGVAEEECCVLE